MTQYGYLRTVYLSFYSSSLYRDVARNWTGIGVVFYLFLLLTVTWAVFMYRMQPIINQTGMSIANSLVPQLPESIKINNGIVSTSKNRPYLIKDTENKDEIIAIIDTSGKYNNLEQANTNILITKNMFYHQSNDGTLHVSQIPDTLNFEMTQQLAKHTVIKFVDWAWMALFPFILIGSLIYRIVESFLYAILGKIISAITGQTIFYETIVKLSLVALTPAIVVSTVLEWFHVYFNYLYLFYFILTMIYLIFALRANRSSEI